MASQDGRVEGVGGISFLKPPQQATNAIVEAQSLTTVTLTVKFQLPGDV